MVNWYDKEILNKTIQKLENDLKNRFYICLSIFIIGLVLFFINKLCICISLCVLIYWFCNKIFDSSSIRFYKEALDRLEGDIKC